jgi:hypothetical protein
MNEMKTLEPPDTFHVDAARGWLGLGDAVSAAAELEHITPPCRTHPAVLHARCEIYHRTKEWDALIAVAETLIEIAPKDPQGWVHRSFALHELKRTLEAFDQLLPAARQFPRNWLIPYNLACYCAQLARLQDSRTFLEAAFALGDAKELKLMALADPDLEPLWTHLSET